MNPFIVQNFSSNKGYQFHNNKPPMAYSHLVQNSYISPVGRNNMLRYPYHIVGSYNLLPQNPKPLSENQVQFGPSSSLFNPISLSRGRNLIYQNYSSPVNVLNGRVKGLAEYTHQIFFVPAKNEMTMKKYPSCTIAESLVVKNFTKSPSGSDTNRTRLLDAFNKNFSLSRPTILDVHDRKRKTTAPVEGVVVHNSYSLLNAKGNKRMKPTCEAQNEHNRRMDNPNAVKKTEGQARSKFVIQEDENGLLRVCSESLLENKNLTNDSVSNNLVGRSNTMARSVDKENEPTDLDLTLHL